MNHFHGHGRPHSLSSLARSSRIYTEKIMGFHGEETTLTFARAERTTRAWASTNLQKRRLWQEQEQKQQQQQQQ